MLKFILAGIFLLASVAVMAGPEKEPAITFSDTLIFGLTTDNNLPQVESILRADTNRIRENKKLLSVIIAIALGPFGGHRIYLGTNHLVPVAYVLTLGGGLGLLPLLDIIAILVSKDTAQFVNNPKFFMWAN